MSDTYSLPPEKSAARSLRITLLYACNICIQAAAFFGCRAFFPKAPPIGFVFLLGCMVLSDLCILVIGLSLRKSYQGSRDAVARYGAAQIVSLLDLLLLESGMIRYLGQSISGRVAERGKGGELGQAMSDLEEIDSLIMKTKSLLNGDKWRQESFYSAVAEATVRFGVLFPRLRENEKKMVTLILEVLDEFKASSESVYRYMFFLSETKGILSRMSAESNRYSTGKMENILAGFKDIVSYSASIGRDVSDIMRDMMEAGGRTSLGGVAGESGKISAELAAFFGEMDSLRGFGDEIIQANSTQLANIRKMAEGIEGFSETIRLISMNVSIEAARLSSSSAGMDARNSGKGFQVLSRNLNDFALKAQELAQSERHTIDEAEGALNQVNASFSKRLDELVARIPEIRSRLDPFEGIITAAFERLESAVRTLGGLSGSVDQRLRAIIGQLQFQDLTRQEMDHIVKFLSVGLSLDSEFGAQAFALPGLSGTAERDIRRRALELYRELATTINEHRVIEAYLSEQGIVLEDADGVDGKVGRLRDEGLSDGSIRMF